MPFYCEQHPIDILQLPLILDSNVELKKLRNGL